MKIVKTNQELFNYSLVNSTLCEFCCQNTETVIHLFWECQYAQHIWTNIQNILTENSISVRLNFESISLGLPEQKQYKTPVNYIILLAKYYIFSCKCLKDKPNFNHFKNYMLDKINAEKHIAQRKDKAELCMALSGMVSSQ